VSAGGVLPLEKPNIPIIGLPVKARCEEINIGSWKNGDPCCVVTKYFGKLLS
jgi:hypothetical protein